MKIKLTNKNKQGVFTEFAKALGATLEGRYFYIPKDKGGGYITGHKSHDDLRILIRNFYLNEETVLERTTLGEDQKFVIFSFTDIFNTPGDDAISGQQKRPTVSIFSHKVYSVITFPSNIYFRSITIGVSQKYLQQVFGEIKHPIVERILENDENFVFESEVIPGMIKVANELVSEKTDAALEALFFRTKANEMLYYLFDNLMKREIEPIGKLHIEDVQSIYRIKNRIEENLAKPPNIHQLAKEANMSEPKLRRLFRQTFGKTVFDYFQSMRMHEASRMLKESRQSVSEVGYLLGFTNLSHFSREFEKCIGMKPKKWSMEN